MSCITAPPADDWWPADDDDEGEPVPPQQRAFTPALTLLRRNPSTGDPDLAADDYDLPARLVFGSLRAPCSDDWKSDLGAEGDVIDPDDADAQAELTVRPEAIKSLTAEKDDGTAAAVTRKRTPRGVSSRGAAAQHVSQLLRRKAVVEAPAGVSTDMSVKDISEEGLFPASAEMSAVATDVAAEANVVPERAVVTTASPALVTLSEEGCGDKSANGDDDEGPGGGGELHAGGSHSMCVLVRPPVPPANAVYPILDELVELVHQHTLQPIKPILMDVQAAPVLAPAPAPPQQPPAEALVGPLSVTRVPQEGSAANQEIPKSKDQRKSEANGMRWKRQREGREEDQKRTSDGEG
ncbi:hypothetical protein VaNZ11_016734 [Volvox africanus]|uniref:Uncharacterized protein n=1 Tax=Volvox africanus TaxID=51714 RepID=A0ABQ5SQZ2_9CHLO|nr:hypothetical protein VaNZ11_016734 [Volvox africanus]